MIVTLYTGKEERGLNVVVIEVLACYVAGRIYARISVDRVRRVTEGLIDDEQGCLLSGRGCVDQIFTLKQIGEQTRNKNVRCMCVLWI